MQLCNNATDRKLTLCFVWRLWINMTGIIRCIELETCCWIMLRQTKERIAKVGQVQCCDVVVNHIRHIEPDFIKAKSLTARVPRERAQEAIELFRGISEPCEVLAQDDDHIRTNLLRLCNQPQLVQPLNKAAD